jgi:two-component system, chemotaxis family, response regulator Rcp1
VIHITTFQLSVIATTEGVLDMTGALKKKILLVEDNPGDQRLLIEALKEAGWNGVPQIAGDGDEALSMLRRDAEGNSSLPNLIILDLNLPRKNGREVLAEIKTDPVFKQIPVVILSSSRDSEDVNASYNLNANCYISKPNELSEFYEAVQSLERFWLDMVMLPMDD